MQLINGRSRVFVLPIFNQKLALHTTKFEWNNSSAGHAIIRPSKSKSDDKFTIEPSTIHYSSTLCHLTPGCGVFGRPLITIDFPIHHRTIFLSERLERIQLKHAHRMQFAPDHHPPRPEVAACRCVFPPRRARN